MNYTNLCPKCRGKLVPVGERTGGFSAGKAVVGAVVAGPVGIAAGALGKKLITLQCDNCGYTIETNEKEAERRAQYGNVYSSIAQLEHEILEKKIKAEMDLQFYGHWQLAESVYQRIYDVLMVKGVRKAENMNYKKGDETWDLMGLLFQYLCEHDTYCPDVDDKIIGYKGRELDAKRCVGPVGLKDYFNHGVIEAINGINYYENGRAGTSVILFLPHNRDKALERIKKWSPGVEPQPFDWSEYLKRPDVSDLAVGARRPAACPISMGLNHIVGLKTDGTVVAAGLTRYNSDGSAKDEDPNEHGKCDVGQWSDIIEVAAGDNITVGLKADGSVVAVGKDTQGVGNLQYWLDEWQDIVAIAVAEDSVAGLKSDGTVVTNMFVYVNINDRSMDVKIDDEVAEWRDIVAIAAPKADSNRIVGLKADGGVLTLGRSDLRQNDTDEWEDVVAISATDTETAGLKADGNVVGTGHFWSGENLFSTWDDIIDIRSGYMSAYALRADGTVVTCGSTDETGAWRHIAYIAKSRTGFSAAVRADGTVVFGISKNISGDVSEWRDIYVYPSARNVELRRCAVEQRIVDERIQEERNEEMARIAEEERLAEQSRQWAAKGLCRYCGGQMSGLFGKKCKSCGKPA